MNIVIDVRGVEEIEVDLEEIDREVEIGEIEDIIEDIKLKKNFINIFLFLYSFFLLFYKYFLIFINTIINIIFIAYPFLLIP